jgi:hypothetical protein
MISEGHHSNCYNVSEKTLCNSAIRLVSSTIRAHSAFTIERMSWVKMMPARASPPMIATTTYRAARPPFNSPASYPRYLNHERALYDRAGSNSCTSLQIQINAPVLAVAERE